jgi:hypothetical protein
MSKRAREKNRNRKKRPWRGSVRKKKKRRTREELFAAGRNAARLGSARFVIPPFTALAVNQREG